MEGGIGSVTPGTLADEGEAAEPEPREGAGVLDRKRDQRPFLTSRLLEGALAPPEAPGLPPEGQAREGESGESI